MNKGLLFQKYRECYVKARSRNTVLTDLEIKKKTLHFIGGGVIGIILGILIVILFFPSYLWSFQFLMFVISLFSSVYISLCMFDVLKAIKVFRDSKMENLKNILKGDWRTQGMKKDEQVNFKNNLIEKEILKKDNEENNIIILEADLKHLLSLIDRKKSDFKDTISSNSKILVFFMGGIWTLYIKDVGGNTSLLNIAFLGLTLFVAVYFFKWYINKIVLDEARECLVICDELTEIKNDIIRKEN
ncbi:hypothetical protein MYRA21_0127 [Myroides sp. A21]|uniref:hypothetical protein n=1 Tax=Myroides sp. A21 TaxID=1583100 RepID=UPI0005863CD3|nr:hypothetical protein [Myroides sp. A21]AJA67371.1 hypothetical protein MYRA21_0127 [Myroides sp. A21]